MSTQTNESAQTFRPGSLLDPAGVRERPISPDDLRPPRCFHDLHLDQLVTEILVDHEDLRPSYLDPLDDIDLISYRQEVFQDLDLEAVRKVVRDFVAQSLSRRFEVRTKAMHEDDGGLMHYFRARMFLNDTKAYCDAVTTLAAELKLSAPRSQGMRWFLSHLTTYLRSSSFTAMRALSDRLVQELSDVRYCISLKGDRITVAQYDDEVDYGQQLRATLQSFRQTDSVVPPARSREWDMYGATGVLDLVAKLYPKLFGTLDEFCTQYADYPDRAVLGFERDVRFYLTYLDYIAPLRESGLHFDYPRMSSSTKEEHIVGTFDLLLAARLHGDGGRVVCNDMSLSGPERILVVSGPNNGGKTTLARTFGQLHYLARLGCPVPGKDARLFLSDQILTHFEKEETGAATGKLQEELDRLRADLQHATPSSIFILNEVFNSTTAQDASFLSRQILERIGALDALAICVTFLDELSRLNAQTVSMVSSVLPEDPVTRTYKVVRARADGRAYAHAIADKYGLSFEHLTQAILR